MASKSKFALAIGETGRPFFFDPLNQVLVAYLIDVDNPTIQDGNSVEVNVPEGVSVASVSAEADKQGGFGFQIEIHGTDQSIHVATCGASIDGLRGINSGVQNPSYTAPNPNGSWYEVQPSSEVPPIIREHPKDIRGIVSDEITISVSSSNADSYQWEVNTSVTGGTWVPSPGATSSSYTHLILSDQTNHRWRCVLTNSYGTTTSNESRILVRPNRSQLWSKENIEGIGAVQVTDAGFNVLGSVPLDTVIAGTRDNVIGSSTLVRTFRTYLRNGGGGEYSIRSMPSATITDFSVLVGGDIWEPKNFTVASNDTNIELLYRSGEISNTQVEFFQINPELPNIITHPLDMTIIPGSTTPITAAADGGEPKWWIKTTGLEWREINESEDPFTGSETGTLSHNGRIMNDAFENASLRCRFSGEGLYTDTNSAIVYIGRAPSITTHPQDIIQAPGIGGGTFTVAADTRRGGTLTYQWQINEGQAWVDIAGGDSRFTGETTNTLTVTTQITSGDDGVLLRAVVSNDVGSTESNAASLEVDLTPEFTLHPQNATCQAGNPELISFTVEATNNPAYQWQINTGTNWVDGSEGGNPAYTGWRTATLTPTGDVSASHNGYQFRCVASVSGATGTATSNVATLTIDSALPVITTQPQDATLDIAEVRTGAFTTATSTSGATCQWQRYVDPNWVSGDDAINTEFTGWNTTSLNSTANLAVSFDGTQYRAVFTREGGTTATTNTATLNLRQKPLISTQPANLTQFQGIGGGTFNVVADTRHGGAMTYQWQKNEGGGWGAVGGARSGDFAHITTTNQLPTGEVLTTSNNGDWKVEVTFYWSGVAPAGDGMRIWSRGNSRNRCYIAPNNDLVVFWPNYWSAMTTFQMTGGEGVYTLEMGSTAANFVYVKLNGAYINTSGAAGEDATNFNGASGGWEFFGTNVNANDDNKLQIHRIILTNDGDATSSRDWTMLNGQATIVDAINGVPITLGGANPNWTNRVIPVEGVVSREYYLWSRTDEPEVGTIRCCFNVDAPVTVNNMDFTIKAKVAVNGTSSTYLYGGSTASSGHFRLRDGKISFGSNLGNGHVYQSGELWNHAEYVSYVVTLEFVAATGIMTCTMRDVTDTNILFQETADYSANSKTFEFAHIHKGRGAYSYNGGIYNWELTVPANPDLDRKWTFDIPLAAEVIDEINVARGTYEGNGGPVASTNWQQFDVFLPPTADTRFTGENTDTLAVTDSITVQDNNLQVRCNVTNVSGTTTSNAATLTVTQPPAPNITTEPRWWACAVASTAGQLIGEVEADSPIGTITYQWEYRAINGGDTWANCLESGAWTGVNTNRLVTGASWTSALERDFRCKVINAWGHVYTKIVRLRAVTAPVENVPCIWTTGYAPPLFGWDSDVPLGSFTPTAIGTGGIEALSLFTSNLNSYVRTAAGNQPNPHGNETVEFQNDDYAELMRFTVDGGDSRQFTGTVSLAYWNWIAARGQVAAHTGVISFLPPDANDPNP